MKRHRKLCLLTVGLLIFPLGLAHAATPHHRAVIERVGWEIGDTGAHVVVAVKGKVDYTSHTASADHSRGLPPRAYVDLRPARLGRAIAREPIAVEDGFVRRIRIGQFDSETVRIVVDLRSPALFDVRTASRPSRLILSLRKLPRNTPLAGVTRPTESGGAIREARDSTATPTVRKPRPFRVVIDPGHGGRDPGARGVIAKPEKLLTLEIAEQLRRELEKDSLIDVILTRSDDRSVSLEERTAVANARSADLFVSLHANASADGKARGIETYTLNNTDDQATMRLAALENGLALTGANRKKGDLAFILSDLLQTGKSAESEAFAASVQRETVAYVGKRWDGVEDLGVKKGPFYVLVGAYMPCILIEVGFLTNGREGRRLWDSRYQADLARGIALGVRDFLRFSSSSEKLENL